MIDQPRPRRHASSDGAVPLGSIGGVVAIGGFALLVVEVIRTLTGGVLGTIGTILLWVGLGVLVAGLLLLVLSLVSDEDTESSTAAEPPTTGETTTSETTTSEPTSDAGIQPGAEPPAGDPVASAESPAAPEAPEAPAEQPPSADGG